MFVLHGIAGTGQQLLASRFNARKHSILQMLVLWEYMEGTGMTDKIKKSGLNVLHVLGIVFVTLKLCEVIDWSWWLVLLPFWFEFAIFLVVISFFAAVAAVLGVWLWIANKFTRHVNQSM